MGITISTILAIILIIAVAIGAAEKKKPVPDAGTGLGALIISSLIVILAIIAIIYFWS